MDNTAASLSQLEQKIQSLDSTNLQQFQKELLSTLYTLRETLVEEIKGLGNVQATTSSDDVEDVKDKRIAELEAENKRLNYRVLHLSRNLREKL